MGEVVDGEYQKYIVMPGDYIREHFFGKYPELLQMVRPLSDEELKKLRRGGHDPEKVYAAYKAAVECKGKPTVILAKTIKGYGLGEAGEGRNVTHQQKKLSEKELREFRSRFGIPISDEEVAKAPFYRPAEDSEEMQVSPGAPQGARRLRAPALDEARCDTEVPRIDDYQEFIEGSGDREASTTMAFVGFLAKLLKDKKIGKYIVPIVPDESRTFGMEGLFRQCGIYSHAGQLYEPVDSGMLPTIARPRTARFWKRGSPRPARCRRFIAAGTAYATHGINMIPFFIYYSMFGFQRIGDLIWAAGDMRAKGFLLGGTAGRTTLTGEGLQHQDGQSLLNAMAFPTVRAYDPAFAYETTTIVLDGMQRMYEEGEDAIYYITLDNENYQHPPMPEGVEEGIIRGIYKVSTKRCRQRQTRRCNCSARAPFCAKRCEPRQILAEQFDVSSNVWSVTSYTELARKAQTVERHNMLHPTGKRRQSYLEKVLANEPGPIHFGQRLRAGRWPNRSVRYVPRRDCSPWAPMVLAAAKIAPTCDVISRSTPNRSWSALCINYPNKAKSKRRRVAEAIKKLGIDPEKIDPCIRLASQQAVDCVTYPPRSTRPVHGRQFFKAVTNGHTSSKCPTWAKTSTKAISSA